MQKETEPLEMNPVFGWDIGKGDHISMDISAASSFGREGYVYSIYQRILFLSPSLQFTVNETIFIGIITNPKILKRSQ